MLYIIDALLFWGPYIIAAVVIVFVIIRFFIRVTKRINKNEGMTKEELKYEVQDGINTVVENSQLIGDVGSLVDSVKSVCSFEGDYPKYPSAEDYINVDDNSKYGHVTTMYQGSNWKCPKCSRSNRAYVGSCACGFNKREKK